MFTGREFANKANSIYYAYITKYEIEDTPENKTIFNAAFYLGCQYAMETSGQLSPHIARFVEFVMWMTERE